MELEEFESMAADVAKSVLTNLKEVINAYEDADIKFVIDVIDETLSQLEGE